MKILIISHNSFSKTSNNGKTLESVFSEFPKENIFQLFFHEGEDPDWDFNANYFKISDRSILKRCLFMGPKPGEIVLRSKDQESKSVHDSSAVLYKKFSRNFLLSLRDVIWGLTSAKLYNAFVWLEDKNIDLVFFVGGDSAFSHKIAIKIAKKLNIPMCVYFTDDYLLYPRAATFFEKYRLSYLQRQFKKTVHHAKQCFAIGEMMSLEYCKYFERSFLPLMNSIDIVSQRKYFLTKNLIISYFGGLHLDRDGMILKLGEILADISQNTEFTFQIKVFSSHIISDNLLKSYKDVGINFCGFVDSTELHERIKETDYLLHVESDSDFNKNLTKLSVSTKIPEYLISGKPIIAFGPEDIASFKILSDNNLASTISSELNDKEMKIKILEILNDTTEVNNRISNAYNFAITNFNREKISNNLHKKLKDIVNENTK